MKDLSASFLHGFLTKASAEGVPSEHLPTLVTRFLAKKAAENPNIIRGFERALEKAAANPANRGMLESISNWLGSLDPEFRQRLLGGLGTGATGALLGGLAGGGRGALLGAGIGAGGYLGWRSLLRPALEAAAERERREALAVQTQAEAARAFPDSLVTVDSATHGPSDAALRRQPDWNINQRETGTGDILNHSLRDTPGAPMRTDPSVFRRPNPFERPAPATSGLPSSQIF